MSDASRGCCFSGKGEKRRRPCLEVEGQDSAPVIGNIKRFGVPGYPLDSWCNILAGQLDATAVFTFIARLPTTR